MTGIPSARVTRGGLINVPPKVRTVDALSGEVAGRPSKFFQALSEADGFIKKCEGETRPLAQRMREAADTLEEASALYGYPNCDYADWCAADLRREAEYVEADR